MTVKSITKYVYKGKEYKSLLDVKEKIHDTIGVEVLDKINRVCIIQNQKDFIKLLDVLCAPDVRKVLLECLNVEYEREGDYNSGFCELVNVLDIK